MTYFQLSMLMCFFNLGYYTLDMFLAYSWINIGNMDTVTINDEQEVIQGLQFGDLEFNLDLYFQCQTAYDRSNNGYNLKTKLIRHIVTIEHGQEFIYGLQFGDLEFDLDLYFQCQMAYDRSINGYNLKTKLIRHIVTMKH